MPLPLSAITASDAIGLLGVAAYLLAHGLVQFGRIRLSGTRYAGLNILGSLLLLYSQIGNFNLASFVSQAIWLVLTVAGFWHAARARGAGGPAQGS